jgi:biopolymer transport protein ExbD
MQFANHQREAACEPDMTPMIDVIFQLIIFFLLTLNFSMDQQSELIKLPLSELSKPEEAPTALPITLQLTQNGTVLIGGDEVTIPNLRPHLTREREALGKQRGPQDATVVIRADQEGHFGLVQELIKACQDSGFERFALRAKQDLDPPRT